MNFAGHWNSGLVYHIYAGAQHHHDIDFLPDRLHTALFFPGFLNTKYWSNISWYQNVSCWIHSFRQHLYDQEHLNYISSRFPGNAGKHVHMWHTNSHWTKWALQALSVLPRLSFFSASHRYSSQTLLRSRQLQWPLLNTHTVAFRVTLAYSPSVTSITTQQGPLTSQGFCTSPTSFCANCYSLANCHNFLNYDIISYNLVTHWTEKETQLTCSTSFSKKHEIKLVLKKFQNHIIATTLVVKHQLALTL